MSGWTFRVAESQSVAFMAEMLPAVADQLQYRGTGKVSILDVGYGTGAGSAFLATILRDHPMYPARVTLYDVASNFDAHVRDRYPDLIVLAEKRGLEYLPTWSYDLVIASHVVEHVQYPASFIIELRRIAKERVFIYAPLEEGDRRVPGHLHSFTLADVRAWGAVKVVEIRSLWWFGKCFLAEFPPL